MLYESFNVMFLNREILQIFLHVQPDKLFLQEKPVFVVMMMGSVSFFMCSKPLPIKKD